MLEFNIAPNTQIGKIDIPEEVHMKENPFMDDKYNRGGTFLDNLASDNYIEFCSRWFGLGGINEVLSDIDDYFKDKMQNDDSLYSKVANDSMTLPIDIPRINDVIDPIVFGIGSETIKPIKVYSPFDRNITYESIAKGVENKNE